MISGISTRSIKDLHQSYRERQQTVSEVVRNYFERIAQNRHLGAYLSEYSTSAESSAFSLDQQFKNKDFDQLIIEQPLWGVPIAIKDNLHIQGEITTCGSRILANYRAPFQATVVKRLAQAGALFLGKTNLDEFAMGGSGENSAFFPTKNPRNHERVSGGSSSGSACAVAADLALVALGSDTGGSIRLPASFCGIVGLKPTYGRVSRFGLVAFGSSLDQVGPMAKNVADLISVYEVIHGHDPLDSTSARKSSQKINRSEGIKSQKLKIGIPREFFVDGLDSTVRLVVEESLQKFKQLGAELIPVSLPHSTYSVAVYYVIAMAEASSNLSRFDGVRFGVRSQAADQAESLDEFYREIRGLFGKEVKRRVLLGSFVLSAGYQESYYRKACQVRRLISEDFKRVFEKVDLIAGPVAPGTAYPLGSHTRDPLKMYLNDLFTVPANLAGLPAISLPAGKDREQMPIGIQLIAPAFQEERLLQVASELESVL